MVVLGQSAQLIPAIVMSQTDTGIRLAIDQPVDCGAAVCVRSLDADDWFYGKVEKLTDTGVLVRVRGSSSPDRREFSRVYGAIRTRYQVVPDEGSELARRRWMTEGPALGEGWHRPDPFMDFSGSGLKFHDQETCKAGDVLLMAIEVQGTEHVFRVTARVVRIDPIPVEECDEVPFDEGMEIPTHCVAVQFIDAQPDAIHALVSFAERIQEAFLN